MPHHDHLNREFGTVRERDDFAWLPVRLDADRGERRPWYRGWVHLRWYRLTERLIEDCGGWSGGLWVTVGRKAGSGQPRATVYTSPSPTAELD